MYSLLDTCPGYNCIFKIDCPRADSVKPEMFVPKYFLDLHSEDTKHEEARTRSNNYADVMSKGLELVLSVPTQATGHAILWRRWYMINYLQVPGRIPSLN